MQVEWRKIREYVLAPSELLQRIGLQINEHLGLRFLYCCFWLMQHFTASSNTSLIPSLVLAEHSTYAQAAISFANDLPWIKRPSRCYSNHPDMVSFQCFHPDVYVGHQIYDFRSRLQILRQPIEIFGVFKILSIQQSMEMWMQHCATLCGIFFKGNVEIF